ncbi:hypothetical protein HOY82DRAFT_544347 [Tuber indicum]|nr:hypothetical protein HOY82DRAFT_544347 [Tuber indicum]
MKRIGRENTRAENGLRAEAESLHLHFNKLLSCPSCGANDSLRGTFIKDCAGKKDQDGRRYRRFVCRVTSTCKRSIGVTEFLQVCRLVRENSSLLNTPMAEDSDPQLQHSTTISGVGLAKKSPRISFTEWSDFITTDMEHKKVEETARKELWDEIFILCNELHKARRDIEDLKCQLSEILPNSDSSRSSSTTVGHKSSEIISDKQYDSITSTSTPSLAHTNEEPFAVKASLPLFQTKADAKSTYSSVLSIITCSLSIVYKEVGLIITLERQDLATAEEPEHRSIKPSRKTRIMTSTALYLEGIPHLPIVKVKELLKATPIRIQLRHIRNISWIDRRVIELLVDTNHSVHIRNRLEIHSKYNFNRSFDPLSPSSFNWEGEPLPELQEAILKRNFVERLATSIASSSSSETRQHVMNWSQNRGLGTQLEAQLKKHGIKISESSTTKNSINTAPNSAQSPSSPNSPFTLPATTICQTAPSRKRRFSLTTELKE